MPTTLGELSALVGGDLDGPADLVIRQAKPLSEAGPEDITLIDRPERTAKISPGQVAAVVVPRSVNGVPLPVIRVDDVHKAFSMIVSYFRPPRQTRRKGIHSQAIISPTAKIAEDVEIGPFCVIGDEVEIGSGTTIYGGVHIFPGCKIGRNVTIFPNVVLYENTVVGDRCIIHAGAVIGAYGFGYFSEAGRHVLAAQLGNVVLGNDVEIGANTTIDRGTYGATTIGEGSKIDNLVVIAHNCRIGRHNIICAQVGIAGSTTTGDYVVMAGQVGVRDHVHIGEGAVLGAMAGVINDIPPNARFVGIPATPEREQMLKQAALAKLPEMRKQLKELQVLVRQLSERLESVESSREAA
ncbi:MAG: UDP-3-O-(3-hydroxymyristoyl)glucosamine N-acyltransferase [Thermogutta sp.]